MDVREKLVKLLGSVSCNGNGESLGSCPDRKYGLCREVANLSYCVIQNTANYLVAHGVTVQEWISVNDRLPNVNTNKSGYESKGVIVLIDGYTKRTAYRIYERACNRGKIVYRWKYPWDRISDENITHWMEMPQPPKGE